MKIGLYMNVFREHNLIIPSIKQWLPFKFHRFIVAASEKPWFGTLEKDDSADLARSLKVEVIEKDWRLEHEQRNEIMDILQKDGCDWIIHWFPDQFLTRADRVKMFEFLYYSPKDAEVFSIDGYTYWRNFTAVIEPPPRIKVITSPRMRFDGTFHIANYDSGPILSNITLYHLQWSKTKADIINKITSYGHASEIDPKWVDNVWGNKEEVHNLHPISPGVFSNLFEHPLPQEIIELLDPKWVQEVLNG